MWLADLLSAFFLSTVSLHHTLSPNHPSFEPSIASPFFEFIISFTPLLFLLVFLHYYYYYDNDFNKQHHNYKQTLHPRLLRLRPSSLPFPAAFPFPAVLAAVFVFLATRLAPSSSTISTPVRYDVVFASLFSCWFHAFTSSGSSLCSFAFSLLSSAASTLHRGFGRSPWYLLPFLSAWSSMAGSSL